MWFKVDDKLHDHRKSRRAGKSAMGVWVLAGSWAMDNETDGFIPTDVLGRWGTAADARRLVDAELWREARHKGEPGWRFHDWSRFQPSAAVTAAKRAAEREAGIRGNHKRWHVERKVNDPDCEYCYRVPDGEPDDDPIGGGESAPIRPVPEPDPITTSPNGEVGPSEPRADVLRICEYLVEAIVENGSKQPAIGKGWLDAGRLMLDSDGRTEQQIITAIDWCQRGDTERGRFWRPNIMSMPKLRQKFDVMRLQAAEEARRSQPKPTNVQGHLAVVNQLAAEEAATLPRQIGDGS